MHESDDDAEAIWHEQVGVPMSRIQRCPPLALSFVLVQDLTADQRSMLIDLVHHYTRLPVHEGEDGLAVQPGCVYLIRPGRDVTLKNGTLRLLDRSAGGQRLPIDTFLRSLAQDQGERAMGILLSGSGSDGADGAQALRSAGGLVMAQNPASTRFDGMPRSALATGVVDYTLPPAEMPAQLLAWASCAFGKAAAATGAPEAAGTLERLRRLLTSRTGVDCSTCAPATFQRRVTRRMALQQLESVSAYLEHVEKTPGEAEALLGELSMGAGQQAPSAQPGAPAAAAPEGPAADAASRLAALEQRLAATTAELDSATAAWKASAQAHSRAQRDLELLSAGTGLGAVFVDHRLRLLRFTPAAAAILHLVQSDVGRPVGRIASNLSGYDRLATDLQVVLNTLQPKELPVRTTEGKWYTLRIQPCRAIDDLNDGAVLSFVEISELVHARDALAKANELLLLGAAVRATTEAFAAQDPDARLQPWTPGAPKTPGWSEAEALLMDVRDPGWIERTGRMAPAGGVAHFEQYSGALQRYYEVAAFRPRPGHVAAVFLDVTARKRADATLVASEARIRAVAQSAHDGIVTTDSAGNVVGWNHGAESIFGYPEAEIRGQPVTRLIPGRYHEAHLGGMDRIEAGGPEHLIGRVVELVGVRADGTEFPLELSLAKWESADGWFITGIIRDVTERRRAQEENARLQAQLQQAQKMESVGRLAGGVAHDFNNMLGVILGHAEMAMEQVDAVHPLYESLTEIHRSAKRSADLTRQLLAFARKQTVAPKVLDLNETLAGLLSMLRRLIGEDIQLHWQPGARLWPVKMDPSQIDQILTNLCVNARDAIADVGRIDIETANAIIDAEFCAAARGLRARRLRAARRARQRLRHGQGDAGAHLRAVLHHQGRRQGHRPRAGHRVRRRQAEPRLHQGVQRGRAGHDVRRSTCRASAGEAEAARPEGGTRRHLRGHETILRGRGRAGDPGGHRAAARGAGLRGAGRAGPGRRPAAGARARRRIHLLLTDVVMPEMNGRELANTLLSLYPHLKCLFMSGYTADVIAHHGVLEPEVHFIHKPFSTVDLAAKVREALDS